MMLLELCRGLGFFHQLIGALQLSLRLLHLFFQSCSQMLILTADLQLTSLLRPSRREQRTRRPHAATLTPPASWLMMSWPGTANREFR